VILPISLALLAFRSLQAFAAILTDKRHMLIAGHEAQDLVDEHKDALKD
jgi:C4-dicarboxylate transporter DctQ subunit